MTVHALTREEVAKKRLTEALRAVVVDRHHTSAVFELFHEWARENATLRDELARVTTELEHLKGGHYDQYSGH